MACDTLILILQKFTFNFPRNADCHTLVHFSKMINSCLSSGYNFVITRFFWAVFQDVLLEHLVLSRCDFSAECWCVWNFAGQTLEKPINHHLTRGCVSLAAHGAKTDPSFPQLGWGKTPHAAELYLQGADFARHSLSWSCKPVAWKWHEWNDIMEHFSLKLEYPARRTAWLTYLSLEHVPAPKLHGLK